jgi:tRNA(adenine34) deaminase
LVLASTLEPCVMCIGAAMTMRIDHVIFGLESPGDGGTEIASRWHNHPDAPFYRVPSITGDVRASEVRTQFHTYATQASNPGMRAWAESLAGPQ